MATRLPVLFEDRIYVRDDILMFHRNGRDLQTDHQRRLPRIIAGGADHMLATDVAFVRLDDPLATVPLDRLSHLGLLIDLGAVRSARPSQGPW